MDADTTLGQVRTGKESITAIAAWAGEDDYRTGASSQHGGGRLRHRCGRQLHELVGVRLLSEETLLSSTNSGNGISRAHTLTV